MKRLFALLLGLTLNMSIRAQGHISKLNEFNVDSFDLWTYYKDTTQESDQSVIGKIYFQRKQPIIDPTTKDTLWPFIKYLVYPITKIDSIRKFESSRTMAISCCYPTCGATFQVSEHFVFWSDPWSIECAFGCNGKDYVRKNADLIFEPVRNEFYDNLDELLENLPIEKQKN